MKMTTLPPMARVADVHAAQRRAEARDGDRRSATVGHVDIVSVGQCQCRRASVDTESIDCCASAQQSLTGLAPESWAKFAVPLIGIFSQNTGLSRVISRRPTRRENFHLVEPLAFETLEGWTMRACRGDNSRSARGRGGPSRRV
jgi:hypothetical protein